MKWPVWRPLFAAICISLFIRTFEIDQKVSAMCYDASRMLWPYECAEPWHFFYWYGRIPPILMGVAGGCTWVFGNRLFSKLNPERTLQIRRGGLFLALLLLIGPALIVEIGIKSLWGRPRPVHCKEFGGNMEFVPVGQWTQGQFPYSSFPSGHAAIAFYAIGPAFVAQSRRSRRGWLIAGTGYGMAMSVTRVLQGGHFLSDVLWAGIIVYLVGAILARIMILPDPELP